MAVATFDGTYTIRMYDHKTGESPNSGMMGANLDRAVQTARAWAARYPERYVLVHELYRGVVYDSREDG